MKSPLVPMAFRAWGLHCGPFEQQPQVNTLQPLLNRKGAHPSWEIRFPWSTSSSGARPSTPGKSTIASDESKPLWYRGGGNEAVLPGRRRHAVGPRTRRHGQFRAPLDQKHGQVSIWSASTTPDYGSKDVRFSAPLPCSGRRGALAAGAREYHRHHWRNQSGTSGIEGLRGTRMVEMSRKVAGAVPHDLGSPGEDPVVNPSQYNYQDVSNWRDMNSKYVLMIWRDYVLTGSKDDAFLRYSWSAVKQAMEHLRQYDTDGDGLIENGGFPVLGDPNLDSANAGVFGHRGAARSGNLLFGWCAHRD